MRIYNITDHPKFVSSEILIKGTRIPAGESIEVKEVDEKLLKTTGLAISYLPDWYQDWKAPKV